MQNSNQLIKEINILKEVIFDRDDHIIGLNQIINRNFNEIYDIKRRFIKIIEEITILKEELDGYLKTSKGRVENDK